MLTVVDSVVDPPMGSMSEQIDEHPAVFIERAAFYLTLLNYSVWYSQMAIG